MKTTIVKRTTTSEKYALDVNVRYQFYVLTERNLFACVWWNEKCHNSQDRCQYEWKDERHHHIHAIAHQHNVEFDILVESIRTAWILVLIQHADC